MESRTGLPSAGILVLWCCHRRKRIALTVPNPSSLFHLPLGIAVTDCLARNNKFLHKRGREPLRLAFVILTQSIECKICKNCKIPAWPAATRLLTPMSRRAIAGFKSGTTISNQVLQTERVPALPGATSVSSAPSLRRGSRAGRVRNADARTALCQAARFSTRASEAPTVSRTSGLVIPARDADRYQQIPVRGVQAKILPMQIV